MTSVVQSGVHSGTWVRRPAPGVTVIRFAGERPLMRAIPGHYGTTMHVTGHSRWKSCGMEWSSAPGSISLKVPGEVVVERAREGRLDFQVVLFEAALVDEACVAMERAQLQPRLNLVPGHTRSAQPLRSLHRHLLNLRSELPDPLLEEGVCAALHALVDVLSQPRGTNEGRGARFSVAVTRARALLDESVTRTVSLETLAAHARLDKFRLCRAFREQVGLPPHAYLTHRRVALAQRLLARGVPQAEVAASVGFYDQSLLHRHFKRILRLTPGAFVRSL